MQVIQMILDAALLSLTRAVMYQDATLTCSSAAIEVEPREARSHQTPRSLQGFSQHLQRLELLFQQRLQEGRAQAEEVAKERDDLVARHSSLATTLEQLQGQHSALVTSRDTLSAELEALRSDHSALSTLHSSLVAERDDLATRHSSLATAFKELESTHSSLVAERDDLATRHSSLATALEELQGQHSSLATERDNAFKERDALKKTISERAMRIAELEAQLADQAERQRQIDAEMAKAEGQLDMLKDLLRPALA
jgi:chromosome segregation ATPase